MTLREAIKFQRLDERAQRQAGLDTMADATHMGIEAMERILNVREVGNQVPGDLLPGETKE